MRCIFCATDLDHSTTPEHILLNALGGRKTTRKVVCSSCNEFFGRGSDQELADSVRVLRNQAQLYSGDGDPPPPVAGPKVEGGRYDLSANGSPIFVPDKPFSVEVSESGFLVELNASNEAHADRMLTNAARKILRELGHGSYPDAAVQAIKADIWKDAQRTISKPPPIRGQLSFGSESAQRSMAKAALVLWAERMGTEKLQGSHFDFIRSFCLGGCKPEGFDDWVQMDARDLPQYSRKYGSNPNIIWVGSNWMGQVYGYFRLYNVLGWRFRLCEIGSVPNTSLCLISNPFVPSVWEMRADDQSLLTHAWVSAASTDNIEQSMLRLSVLGQHGQQRQFERFLEKTIQSAFRTHSLGADGEPTPKQSEEIKDYILSRLRVLFDGTPIDEGVPRPTG